MNKNIIIALIVIVLIILGGLLVFSQNNIKTDTQIKFLGNTSLKNGQSVSFELIDAQGNALAGKELNIVFESPNGTEKFTIETDSEGRGSLVINNESSGTYNITVSFDGADKYNACSANETITLIDDALQGTNYSNTYQSSSSYSTTASSSSGLNYDDDLNVKYDSNGKVVGGQNDGADYEDLKNNRPNVVDGNLE
jgi:hypothetical protein